MPRDRGGGAAAVGASARGLVKSVVVVVETGALIKIKKKKMRKLKAAGRRQGPWARCLRGKEKKKITGAA